MWLIKINGVSKDDFHDTCFMSAQCKNVSGVLHAQYHLKRDALSDVRDLQDRFPDITYELVNLGRTRAALWFY